MNEATIQSNAWRRGTRLGLGLCFLTALLAGFFFQAQIVQVVQDTLPAPNAGWKILYWTSPMDTSVQSDTPGKDSMGMDLVPVHADQPEQKPVVIDPTLVERDVTTARVQRGRAGGGP
jgi:hypothetical protein